MATWREYWKQLKNKLKEEVGELVRSETIEEFADVLEVFEVIAKMKKFSKSDISAMKSKKRRERGGFQKKIILEKV